MHNNVAGVGWAGCLLWHLPMYPSKTVYTSWYTCARSSGTALLHQACMQEQSVLAAWAVSAVVGCCMAVLLHALYTLLLCIMPLAGAGRVAGLCHCAASIQAPTIVLLCSYRAQGCMCCLPAFGFLPPTGMTQKMNFACTAVYHLARCHDVNLQPCRLAASVV